MEPDAHTVSLSWFWTSSTFTPLRSEWDVVILVDKTGMISKMTFWKHWAGSFENKKSAKFVLLITRWCKRERMN